ncbi:hypothetical protein VMT65_07135 [Nocardia sp. CDC153]|uniref:hypothetical protein n=1 Tax=Nocardia sp. CDC153 TaxID=3112167 RepID=UPI002DB719EA|nr:hypothetical protein [Nocardia sp. CDC153]MEC3952799.1 hypothetical protein [Nocardia sp. CDC153]
MTRSKLFHAARSCGYVFWWVFIAATMVAGGISWFGDAARDDAGWIVHGRNLGEPRRYTDCESSASC